MASPPLSTIRQIARDYSGDNDPNAANYAVSATLLDEIINRFYSLHKRTTDPWPQELAATVTGLTYNTGVNTVDTTLTTIREIKSLYTSGSAGSTVHTSEALELCPDYEIDEWTVDYTPALNEPIKRFSRLRLGDGTKAAGTVGRWRVRVHPAPQATSYLVARCILEPAVLSAATDVPDLSDDEGYGLGVAAGAWMARYIGREDMVPSVMSEIPASMQATAQAAMADHAASTSSA